MNDFILEVKTILNDYSIRSKTLVFPIRYKIIDEMYGLGEIIANGDYFYKKNGKFYIEDLYIESKVLNNKTKRVYTNLNVSTFKDRFKKPTEQQVKLYIDLKKNENWEDLYEVMKIKETYCCG